MLQQLHGSRAIGGYSALTDPFEILSGSKDYARHFRSQQPGEARPLFIDWRQAEPVEVSRSGAEMHPNPLILLESYQKGLRAVEQHCTIGKACLSKQRRMNSRASGDRCSGIGGGPLEEAMWNIADTCKRILIALLTQCTTRECSYSQTDSPLCPYCRRCHV